MALLEINRNPSTRELRQFGCIFLPLFLAIVGGYLFYRNGSTTLPAVLGAAAGVSLVIGLAAPSALKWLFVGWLTAAYPIGWVVSHAILAAVYYLVMTPIGLALRLAGYDPLMRRFDRTAGSYWSEPRRPRNESQYFRQF